MDYFDSNLKDKMSDFDNQLPPGMDWENMREGVYEKMGKRKPNNLWKWFSLCLLLLLGGCGGWMALNYFNPGQEQDLVDQEIINDKPAIARTKTELAQEIIADKIDQQEPATNSNELINSSSIENKTAVKEPKKLTVQPPSTTITILNKTPQTQNASPQKTPADKLINLNPKTDPKASESIAVFEESQHLRNDKESISKDLSLLTNKQPLPLVAGERLLENFLQLPPREKNREDKIVSQTKSIWSAGVSVGANSWAALATKNTNQYFVSGFPGYSGNAFLQYNLTEKNAIVLGYQFSLLQERFDYEATKNVELEKPNVLIRQYVSSLTGNVVGQDHGDTTAQATRYIRELKYNAFQLHTLQLSYARSLAIGKRSNLQLAIGGEYLFKINGKGKRLNKLEAVSPFDQDNPVFANNQFALRLALAYEYSIAKRTSLFTQIAGAKYLTNWELNDNGKTQPLIYGVSLGIRQAF